MLTLNAQDLFGAMKLAKSHCRVRTAVEVLKYARISCHDGHVSLETTDLDSHFEAVLESAQGDCRPVLLPIDAALKYLKTKSGTIKLWRDDSWHLGTDDQTHMQFDPPDAGDFPEFDFGSPDHTVSVSNLLTALQHTAPFMSTEEARFYLNGVCLTGNHAVATDGKAMAVYDMPVNNFPASIIPPETVKSLLVALKGMDGAVKISRAGMKVRFSFGPITITTKLIDASFPNYRRCIPPASNLFTLDINTRELPAGKKPMLATFAPSDETMSVKIANDVFDVTPSDCTGPARFSLDLAYLKRFCSHDLHMNSISPRDPFRVTNDDENFLGIVMPVAI